MTWPGIKTPMPYLHFCIRSELNDSFAWFKVRPVSIRTTKSCTSVQCRVPRMTFLPQQAGTFTTFGNLVMIPFQFLMAKRTVAGIIKLAYSLFISLDNNFAGTHQLIAI